MIGTLFQKANIPLRVYFVPYAFQVHLSYRVYSTKIYANYVSVPDSLHGTPLASLPSAPALTHMTKVAVFVLRACFVILPYRSFGLSTIRADVLPECVPIARTCARALTAAEACATEIDRYVLARRAKPGAQNATKRKNTRRSMFQIHFTSYQ